MQRYFCALLLVAFIFIQSCDDQSECPACTVDGDTESISDGDTTDLEGIPKMLVDREVSFGAVVLGRRATRELTIYSIGSAPLSVISVKLNTTTDEITIDNPIDETLEIIPSEDHTILISYLPQDPGTDSAILDIYTNDPENQLIQVEITSSYKGNASLSASITGDDSLAHVQTDTTIMDVTVTATPENAEDNRIITLSAASLTASEHFSIVSSTNQTPIYLGPLMQHTFQVRFQPQSAGVQEAVLSIANDSDDAGQRPLEITLHGTGGQRSLEVAPENIDFGTIQTQETATQNLNIAIPAESYAMPVIISEISIVNDSESVFAPGTLPPLPYTVTSADSIDLNITYTPSAVEGNTAVLRIVSDDHFYPTLEIPLSGTGAIKDLRIDSPNITFDPACIASATTATIGLRNSGGIPVQIDGISFTPELSPITTSEIFPIVLPPEGTYDFSVSFSPSQEGAFNASATVLSDSDTSVPEILLQATGHAPILSRTPENIVEFGSIHVADTAEQRLTFENTGECTISISDLLFSEGSSPAFTLSETIETPLELQPEETLAVDIAFDALGTTGDTWGTLQITTNLPDPAINVGIHATAIQPIIDISPANGIAFGELHEGATSDTQPVTVRNAGFGTLTITNIAFTGNDTDAFAISGLPETIPFDMQPGDSLALTLMFSPEQQQEYSATLSIESNDRSVPALQYSLTGTGAPCPENYIDCDDDPRTCEVFCIPGGDEVCDGRDNNCNCAIDETFEELGNSCPGVGVCAAGVVECNATNPLETTCSTLPGGSLYDPLAPLHQEICDTLDNDCNGVTDDGFGTGTSCEGVGICPDGIMECFSETASGCSTLPGGSQYNALDPIHNEICDEVDNNCNGETDELFGTGIPCDGTGTCGIGTVVCSGDFSVVCSTDIGGPEYDPLAPQREEVCDNQDNDCDGETDESFNIGTGCEGIGECGTGIIECSGLRKAICSTDIGGSEYDSSSPLRQEICDSKDNDCDGNIDENWAVNDPCDGVGECGIGIIECATANSVRCSTDPDGSQFDPTDPSHTERCDDLDNDCDGNVDEDFAIGLACNGVGRCGSGTWECLSAFERICSSMPGGSENQAQAEICNSIDDNCNGVIDDGYMTDPDDANFFCLALGECGWGHMECISTSESACSTDIGGSQYEVNDPLRQEVCDGRDNDCDGYFDEGYDVYDACDGTGECGIGVWECVWQTGDRRCSTDPGGSDAASDSGPRNENDFGVDGLDNDCDGIPDDPWKASIYRYRNDISAEDMDSRMWQLPIPPAGYTAWGTPQFSLYNDPQTGFDEVMRYENAAATDHLYTIDLTEAASLDPSWIYQGALGYAAANPGDQTIAVYRLYNAALTVHVYTASETEKTTLLSEGYEDQGIAFYGWLPLP